MGMCVRYVKKRIESLIISWLYRKSALKACFWGVG